MLRQNDVTRWLQNPQNCYSIRNDTLSTWETFFDRLSKTNKKMIYQISKVVTASTWNWRKLFLFVNSHNLANCSLLKPRSFLWHFLRRFALRNVIQDGKIANRSAFFSRILNSQNSKALFIQGKFQRYYRIAKCSLTKLFKTCCFNSEYSSSLSCKPRRPVYLKNIWKTCPWQEFSGVQSDYVELSHVRISAPYAPNTSVKGSLFRKRNVCRAYLPWILKRVCPSLTAAPLSSRR